MSARFSPDGLYYWDGVQWLSTISPDGRFRWDGGRWVVLPAGGGLPSTASSPARQPTSWTRPLQYAVVAYYGVAALYALTLPFTMSGLMTQAFNQSIQHQQSLYPTVSPPPPGFTDAMTSIMNGVFWVAAVVGFAICLLGIIAALRRWTWAFYAILVLFGLGAISLPIDIIELFAGSAISSLNGISMPAWIYVAGTLSSAISTALFIWMLVALVKRGPWAMSRPGPAPG